MLIDIHSHLDHSYFKEDIGKVIENAKQADVKIILTAGINPETNRKALELSKKYDIVKPCLGIYPIQALQKEIESGEFPSENDNIFNLDEEIKYIEKNRKNIAAIGEVGLDYSDLTYKSEQQKQFEKMIALAERASKPIIVHSRKAEEDVIEMLKSSKLKKIIMHCFGGKKSLVKKIADNGWYLTAPTCITRATQFQENVKLCPITQLFCETDAPYLSPYKNNDGSFNRNEPAFIIESYKKIAEIKGMEVKEVINNVWMNWQKVF